MLTFLRKIRKSLINSGATRKYLLYAIGEILLVMIGILLALQVNNWNEGKKTNQLDQEFLQNLKTELTLDTIAFHNRKQWYSSFNELLIESINILSKNSSPTDKQIDIVSRSIGHVEILTPLYKNISRNNAELAMGRLERINPEINKMYHNYLERYQSDFEVCSKFGESLQRMSMKYIYPNVQYKNAFQERANFDIENIQNNPNFINTFHRSVGWRNVYLEGLNARIDDVVELLALIEGEINRG